MMRGVNDQLEHAQELAELLRGRPLRIQLVNFNPHVSIGYAPTSQAQIDLFIRTLTDAGIPVHHGLQLGKQSGAGCGQLDADYRVGELKRRAAAGTRN
jgi:23S rRNA (adenine2503-C2)-methyltransferase